MIFYKKGKVEITLRVNGHPYTVWVRPSDVLLDVLRGELGLIGAKPGCRNGDCGACTVVIDGLPAKSCLVLACTVQGKEIITVEGIGESPLAKAFSDARAFQCGYCTPGFLMASYALLQSEPQADEGVMEAWLQGNICRCTSYAEIRAALESVLPSTAKP